MILGILTIIMKNQWDSLWSGYRILTMDEKMSLYQYDALAIEKGKIVWLGQQDEIPENNASVHHQGNGELLTPGLIDCHTHLVYAGSRASEYQQRLAGQSYQDIAETGGGILKTVTDTRNASFDELYHQSATRLKHFLAEGVTSIEIKSGYGLDLETERKMLQVAKKLGEVFNIDVVKTCLAAHTVPVEYQSDPESYVDYCCEEIIPALAAEGLVDSVDVFCESIAFSLPQARKIFYTAESLGCRIKCHGEQFSHTNISALAANLGALSVDHCEYISEMGAKTMAQKNTCAVLLPAAFYYLNEQHKPPIDLFRDYGVSMAVASDCNPGSAPILSLLITMNLACQLFDFTVEEAFAGVTVNAAKALGIERGSIAVGRQADFVIWNAHQLEEIFYQLGSNPCKRIIKNGEVRHD